MRVGIVGNGLAAYAIARELLKVEGIQVSTIGEYPWLGLSKQPTGRLFSPLLCQSEASFWSSEHLAASLELGWEGVNENSPLRMNPDRMGTIGDRLFHWSPSSLHEMAALTGGMKEIVDEVQVEAVEFRLLSAGRVLGFFDAVVLAAGTGNQAILSPSEVDLELPENVFSRRWIYDLRPDSTGRYLDDLIPYGRSGSLVALRSRGSDLVEIGHSWETNPGEKLLAASAAHNWAKRKGGVLKSEDGRHIEPGPLYVKEPHPGLLVAGGLGRYGIGLAGGLALEVRRRLLS